MNVLRYLLGVITSIMLIGCGGESGTTSQTAYLIDSPISGVYYINGDNTGYTQADGSFTYNGGEVSFYIGNMLLGTVTSIKSDNTIFPQDLLGLDRTNLTDEKVIRLARLLQSIDSDTTDDKLTIDSTARDHFNDKSKFTDFDDNNLTTTISHMNRTLKNKDEAISHLADSIRKNSIMYNSVNKIVLKTGQTKSYDRYGNEVTDGSIKDDGYYQKGATRSYTRDNAVGIVTDNTTHLMWQDNESVQKPWVTQANYDAGNYNDTSGDTASTYCTDLTLGGYSDWRLPKIEELQTIVDYGKDLSGVDTVFQFKQSDTCWTSNNSNANNDSHIHVFNNYGYRSKDMAYDVRCVR